MAVLAEAAEKSSGPTPGSVVAVNPRCMLGRASRSGVLKRSLGYFSLRGRAHVSPHRVVGRLGLTARRWDEIGPWLKLPPAFISATGRGELLVRERSLSRSGPTETEIERGWCRARSTCGPYGRVPLGKVADVARSAAADPAEALHADEGDAELLEVVAGAAEKSRNGVL